MDNQPKIEVIIPTHNTPIDLLKNCFESVLKQDYENFKVYIIEDGSTIENKEALDDLVKTLDDDRFEVIHHNGKGVSAARNVGISKLEGDYIAFVDADDELELGIWKKVISKLENSDFDVAVFGWIDDAKDSIVEHAVAVEENVVSASDFQARIAADNFDCGGGYPWNKIWKREAILRANGQVPDFDVELNRYEDKLWCLMAADGLNKVLLMPERGYRYNYQPNSLTQNEADAIKRMNLGYLAYTKMADFLQGRNKEAYERCLTYQFIFTRKDIQMIKKNANEYGDQLQKSKKAFDDLCKRIMPGELRLSKLSFAYWIWRAKH